MLRVVGINPQTDPRWLPFVLAHEAATIFHHPNWIRVLESTYNFRSVCLACVRNEDIVGILPLLEVRSWLTGRRAVCLPYSDVCALLSQDAEVENQFVSYCSHLIRQNQWKHIEIRGAVTHPSLVASSRFKTHTAELNADSEKVFQRLKKSQVQRNINKSSRSGVTVERRPDLAAMKEFIRLNVLTRKKHGMPPQPDKFFLNFHETLILKNNGFVGVAIYEDKIIAASVFLHFKNSVFYKYGASDEAFLKHRPNHLIMWDAVKWGCENGYRFFNFGRTDLDNEGLIDYKRGWGTIESDLVYYRMSGKGHASQEETNGIVERMKPIMKRLPTPALKTLGKFLYGHVG